MCVLCFYGIFLCVNECVSAFYAFSLALFLLVVVSFASLCLVFIYLFIYLSLFLKDACLYSNEMGGVG